MSLSYFSTKFDATLLDEKTRDGRRLWRLNSQLVYYSALLNVVLTVPAGFVTDLESCPRYPVVYWLVGDLVQEPACLHDWLYSTAPFSRLTCDQILREASIAMKTKPWQADVIYAGVRLGGASHFGPQYTK